MKKAFYIFIVLTGFIQFETYAQNVGIGTTTPTSAVDINGGLRLRPENTAVSGTSVMLTSNRAHHVLTGSPTGNFTIAFIGATQEGQHLILTNTTLFKGFLVPVIIPANTTVELIYSNAAWKQIGSNEAVTNAAWGLKGNAGTDTSVNFIGTTDFMPLAFGVNNQRTGLIDLRANVALGFLSMTSVNTYTDENTAIGAGSLSKLASGTKNTAIGVSTAGNLVAGSYNVAIGSAALFYDTQGDESVAVGPYALFKNKNRYGNTAIGAYALLNNASTTTSPILLTEGLHNTAVGNTALGNNRRGSGAVAIGYQAAYSDTAAEGVVAIGRAALYNNNGKHSNLAVGDSALFNTGFGATEAEGFDNVGIGTKALFKNVQGYYNTAMGSFALYNNISSANTAFGNYALFSNTHGAYNVGVGQFSLYNNTYGIGNTAIGMNSLLKNATGNYNTAVGFLSLKSSSGTTVSSNGNTAIGSYALADNLTGNNNTSIGDSVMVKNTTGYSNVAIGTKALANNLTGNGNIAIGAFAGNSETTSNKLYIDNSNADKNNALIYGDFAADSLLLNGKTVVKNNAVVRGFTKLGGYGTDVPSIKMKELTGTTDAVKNGSVAISLGGVDPLKIISVSTLVGIAGNAVWLPNGYDSDPRFKYNYYVHTNGNLYIQNQSTDCTTPGDHICSKTVKIVVTYKE